MTKFCKDCKHLDGVICKHPNSFNIVNLVTGKKTQDCAYASAHRRARWLESFLSNRCGKAARWFEPKI